MTAFRVKRRFARILGWLLGPWLNKIDVAAGVIEEIQRLRQTGQIVVAMRASGLLDLLVIRSIFKRHKIPIPTWTNVDASWTEPADLADAAGAGASGVMFVTSRRMLIAPADPASQPAVLPLLHHQATATQKMHLLPTVILWVAAPIKERPNPIEILLGPTEYPGPFRQLLWLFRYRGEITLRIGEAIDLSAFVNEHKGDADALLARKLRLSLRYHFRREERSVIGPRRKSQMQLVEASRHDEDLETAIAEEEKKGKPREELQHYAEACLKEIGSDYSTNYVRMAEWVLGQVWEKIFDGIQLDEQGLDRIREACKDGPVIIAPSHKSHVDYLIISYLFKVHRLPLPFIAAGINLAFWPMGHIFRKMGAFFLRRSFKDDPIYKAAFQAYVRTILREGINIEFFIEGTRSRTGRLMPPRFGMLQMILDAYAHKPSQDIRIFPVTLDYERLLDQQGMVTEARGGEKESESLTGMLRIRKLLQSRYGYVHVQFGEVLSLQEYLGTTDVQTDKDSVQKLGYEVLRRIGNTVTVTPTALAAAALCIHHKRGIEYDSLVRKVRMLEEPLRLQNARFARALSGGGEDAIVGALHLFQQAGLIKHVSLHGQTVYVIEDEKRLWLDYYKNTVIQFLLPYSFAALALHGTNEPTAEAVWGTYARLHETFKYTFNRVTRPPERQELEQVLAYFESREWIRLEANGRIFLRSRNPIYAMENVTINYLESYYIILMTLTDGRFSAEPHDMSTWTKLAMELGEILYAKGDVWRYESRSKITLQNVLQFMVDRGILLKVAAPATTKRKKPPTHYEVTPESVAQMTTTTEFLQKLLFRN